MSKGGRKHCPFRKIAKKILGKGENGALTVGYYDDFKFCEKGRCMAYKDGRCLRFEPETREAK